MTEEIRIPPLRAEEWSEEQRQLLDYAWRKGGFYNVIGTLARHMEASKRIGQMGAHVMGPTSTLTARDRELLILRTAWNCQSEYEWAQHVQLGLKAGLSEQEIEFCRGATEEVVLAAHEKSLLRAADELHAHQRIADDTWAALLEHYDELQLMDIVFAVGQYTMIAMALKTFGTPLDEGLPGFQADS